jgi:4-hydroxy-tetrahydrodipicolinate reductase
MKIALIGYGKMGKTIEEIAISQGHCIVAKVDRDEDAEWDNVRTADVAIEFSQPESAFDNIVRCFELDIPVVCGTTGWLKKLSEIESICKTDDRSFFYASNYSIGVNIFFEINKLLARLMDDRTNYDEIIIHECHHLQKLDAPSGTAITIAEQIIRNISRLKSWSCYKDDENVNSSSANAGSELPIFSSREDEVPGTHIVKYFSEEDEIEIIHKAFNRQGFAKGALAAASWLSDKKGMYGMKDLLSL